LEKLKPFEDEAIASRTYRARYEGFEKIEGVKDGSQTETFFKIKAELSHPRWTGVPIYMEAGKRIKDQVKDIIVTFKHEESCNCPPGVHYTNRIIFSLEPEESIRFEFWAKKPGYENEIEKRSLDFMFRKDGLIAQYVEEYEKLLLDAIRGDQTLFVSTSEVKSMWAFVDRIVAGWQKGLVPLDTYEPDTVPDVRMF
jgi:glucose-6-phosphate 1-dehydrogenase